MPTNCQTQGFGRCLCNGHGVILRLLKGKISKWLAALCPKKTVNRRLLVSSSLVLRFHDNTMVHIALMYLRPVRPTYIRLRWQPNDRFFSRQVVHPIVRDNKFDHLSDVDLASLLPYREEVAVTAFKFVAFDKPMARWFPAYKLTIDDLPPLRIEGQRIPLVNR